MEYVYRTTSITIGNKTFDLDNGATFEQIFAYCEERFGFKGEKWDEIKEYYESEAMGVLIERQGEKYSEVIGC